MANITQDYGRNFDLNLLRVFVAVAEAGSVTRAAAQLYLTQPAVSAALRRLQSTLDATLFARSGRGLSLTRRGEQLLAQVRPHLGALLEAALEPPRFDPRTSEYVARLGIADSLEGWLLPALLRALAKRAPRIKLVVSPVHFRSVRDALLTRSVDAALTVADELPASILRKPLLRGKFVALYDPRHLKLRSKLDLPSYFAQEHVIVSYNGDLRGVVEDELGRQRRVRCSLASFAPLGAVVEGSNLLATVPELVAAEVRRTRPHLRTTKLPFALATTPSELLWPLAVEGDEAARFVRALIVEVAERSARELVSSESKPVRRARRTSP